MSALLTVKNISKSYKVKGGLFATRKFKVLDDISFELEASEILAVVGESGSGKSTLARQIVMLEKPDSGEIYLHDQPVANVPDVHRSVRMIFQDPETSLNPRKRVSQLLEEPLLNYTKLSASRRSEKIEQALQQVGLSNDQASRFPHMFSGGQRQRLAIARAMILQPEIIVADEAVSAQDVSVQAQILNLVMELKAEYGLAWLFIAHDINVVRAIADRVVVLYAGRIMEAGSASNVLQNPHHPYTRKLLDSVPRAGQQVDALNIQAMEAGAGYSAAQRRGCVYRRLCPLADERCAQAVPPMKSSSARAVACFKAGSES